MWKQLILMIPLSRFFQRLKPPGAHTLQKKLPVLNLRLEQQLKKFHLNLLRKLGVAREKIDLLPVWREAGVYSQRELAALAWAEIMTGLSPGGASDEAYAALLSAFSVEEATFLNVAIATINAWNRLGVALRFAPLTLRAPSPPRPVDA